MAGEAKPTATERFHPVNQRLTRRARIEKLPDSELEMWIAHGIMAAAALKNSSETYDQWSWSRGARYKTVKLLRDWAALKLTQLERERDRRINYYRRLLNGKQAEEIKAPRHSRTWAECPPSFRYIIDEAGRIGRSVWTK